MINRLLSKMGVRVTQRRITDRDLIKAESKIGGKLFGAVPEGHRREFFCLDSKTWVWHEEWLDSNGRTKTITTRYEVRPNGVMKMQDGQPHTYVEGQELNNLAKACQLYYSHVSSQIYGYNQSS